MRFYAILTSLTLVATLTVAAPELGMRQNDVPNCKDGTDGPQKHWHKGRAHVGNPFEYLIRSANLRFAVDSAAKDCKAHCYMMEQAEGDSQGNVCKDRCVWVGRYMLDVECFGKSIYLMYLSTAPICLDTVSWTVSHAERLTVVGNDDQVRGHNHDPDGLPRLSACSFPVPVLRGSAWTCSTFSRVNQRGRFVGGNAAALMARIDLGTPHCIYRSM